MRLLTACFAAALITGCTSPTGEAPQRRFLFSGNLASIDGEPSTAGVRIEIWAHPGSEQPVAYDIHTGCRLSGSSDDGTRFNGAETLTACSQAEVETIARLNRILAGPSSLNLDKATAAEFVSPRGRVRFERIR